MEMARRIGGKGPGPEVTLFTSGLGSVGRPAMAERGRDEAGASRPRRRRPRASPPPEARGEVEGGRWGGERGVPRRPHRAREGERPAWSCSSSSNLEGEEGGPPWLPPGRGRGEEEDDVDDYYYWGAPMRSPQEEARRRESRRGSLEPPHKRARRRSRPPRGEGGWRGSQSPTPKGRAFGAQQRQPSRKPPTSSCSSGSSGGKVSRGPRAPHSPPRDRRGSSPQRESRGRSPTRHSKGPSTDWDPESPPPIRRVAEGRPRGLEEPPGGGGSSSSSHRRSRGDPEWETRQVYSEGRGKASGGSWRGSSFRDLPHRDGDQGGHPSRGGKRGLDPSGPSRERPGRQEWEEGSEESGGFSPQSWLSPERRRRRPDDREPTGIEEERWARDGGRERYRRPTQDQDEWDRSPEVLEDWAPKEGRWEGQESGQRGPSGWPAKKRPTPAVGWVPCEEVVNYWKRCHSLLPKKTRTHFLSTCPRPTIPDGSTQISQINWSLLDLLSSRQVLRVSSVTRYSLASQVELMDMLAPAMVLYEMAESAIEDRQVVDPLDVQELSRRLVSYAGSLNQSFTMQRCSQVLGWIAPQLRGMTNQMSSRNASRLLFAEEKVKLIEDVLLRSMEEEEVNRSRSSGETRADSVFALRCGCELQQNLSLRN